MSSPYTELGHSTPEVEVWESEGSEVGYSNEPHSLFGSPGSELSESSDASEEICFSAHNNLCYKDWMGGPELGVAISPLPWGEPWNESSDRSAASCRIPP